jgi:tRNA modification GTPase
VSDYRSEGAIVLDEVVFVVFKGPRSFTGEDTLEISCHGNPLIAQKILEDLVARGCRLAEPGEFTQRAFVNGRMDLSQAEAVLDVIHARSERALSAANQQLRGALRQQVDAAIEQLLGVIAHVEAYIDFPDEDLPPEDRSTVVKRLEDILAQARKLRATKRYGDLLRGGIRTVIVGKTNAGKSSLLNQLVGEERAIVSPEPGTTRDFIEHEVTIGPHAIRLIDTAGLNDSPAPLEALGIAKTWERVEAADLILVVEDATDSSWTYPAVVAKVRSGAPLIFVINKCDLPAAKSAGDFAPGTTMPVFVSALSGAGLDELRNHIIAAADQLRPQAGDEAIAVNARHATALLQVEHALVEALTKLANEEPVELLASDLRGALAGWEEIGGRVDNERVLDHLFATFCIGK